jgi:aspartate carbamoyltransferase catalytic subunit
MATWSRMAMSEVHTNMDFPLAKDRIVVANAVRRPSPETGQAHYLSTMNTEERTRTRESFGAATAQLFLTQYD